jgi:hemolysin activation/secretion protein
LSSIRPSYIQAFATIFFLALAPMSSAATAATDAAPAAARFDVLEIRVLGNSVLDARAVEGAVYPFLGSKKSIEDMEAARAALEKLYHDKGFGTVFVDLPEQDVDDGVVRLKVTEGRLNAVRVTGARYFSERHIRILTPAASVGAVPKLPDLQQQLAAVNAETRDRSVVPVLKAGPVPGTVDLALKVDDQLPLHGSVEINNQRTPNTSPLRALYTLSYDNLFDRFDNVSVQYQHAPQHGGQLGVLAGSYSTLVNSSGARLSILYIDSSSDVATVGALGVLGKGKVYGTRLMMPLEGVGPNQSITLGADYKRFRESIVVDPKTSLNTPINYVNFSAAYAGMWPSDALQVNLNSIANFGVRGVVNEAREFANKRFQGRPNYFYLRSDASVDGHLPKGFHLTLRLSGQYTVEPLISNEHFSIAGVDGVRGYLEAEELGDEGLKETLQFGSPRWAPSTWLQADAFAFFDDGRLNFLGTLPQQATSITLRSWGFGVNASSASHLISSLIWAYPLLDGSSTKKGDARLLFSVRAYF